MSFGRRGFLRSVAIGSTAALVGCDSASTTPPEGADAGACSPPAPPPPAPLDLDYPAPSWFEQIASDLDAAGIGDPVVLVDLDRAEANVDAIVAGIRPLTYRIVVKSLPSLDLLELVSSRSGSASFMVLHLPLLPALLARFPGADVLVGKCHLTSAVRAFFDDIPVDERADAAARVTFLADDGAQLDELVALAGALGLTLKVAIELDVGLGRSGVEGPEDLPALLDRLLATSAVRFAGFLGYDGHIAYTSGTREALDRAWADAMARYQAFVDVLNGGGYDALAALPDLVFDGGGSATYPMYAGRGTPVNDVAAGGGVLRPGAYPDHVLDALRPAVFIATPVLQRYASPRLPGFSAAASAAILDGRQGLTIQGGAWPGRWTYPEDVRPLPAPLFHDPGDVNLVPNQGLVTAPPDLAIGPGDRVFYHPRQSDALFLFERIHVVRGGRLQRETMAAYPRRY